MCLINTRLRGIEIPNSLPPSLAPSSGGMGRGTVKPGIFFFMLTAERVAYSLAAAAPAGYWNAIPSDERQKYMEIFKKADKNGDGFIK